MGTNRVPASLRERLGTDATGAFLELLDTTRQVSTAEVTAIVEERFERRLVEETSALRVEMAHGFAGIRVEMAQGLAAVRQEMAQMRVELLKWAFFFWVGQLFAMAGLFMALVRLLRPDL